MRLSLGLVAGLALPVAAQAQAPQVAVDIPPVHGLVAQVMDGVGVPDLILPPGVSPHDAALRPSDAQRLAAADLVVWVGPELSPAVTRSIEALADGAVLTLLDVPDSVVLNFREGAVFEPHDHGDEHGEEHAHDDEHGHDDEHAHDDEHGHDDENGHDDEHAHDDEHGHEDEHAHDEEHAHEDEHGHDDDVHAHDDAHGHDHDGRDPHAWLDPANAVIWLPAIAEALSEIDPANATTYAENAQAAAEAVTQAQADIATRLAPLQGRSFIVFHDAYHYFEARFGIEAAGAIAVGDGVTPGPRRLAEIRAAVEDLDVTCIFAEPQFNPGYAEAVMAETGTQVGVIDPLGVALEPGPDLYLALLDNMATSFETCLGAE